MGDVCEHCGQQIPLTRKEPLNKAKAMMLKRAAGHVMKTMKNDFMVRDFSEPAEFKTYNFFSHLRLHGLIFKVKINGRVQRGRWGITRNGWAWLRGEIALPSYVLVKNNGIESRADSLIFMRDVWYGSDYMQTTFEYFDEDGKPVGFRPTVHRPQVQQASLL